MLAYLNFRFKFIDNKGKKTSVMWREGQVSDEGVMLHRETIRLRDIEKVSRYSNKIIIVLKPYITISQTLTNNILKDTHSIVLQIVNQSRLAHDVKSTIDQKIANILVKEQEKKLEAEGKTYDFRVAQCPSCNSKLNLSGYKPTPLIHCDYCETIFEAKGMPLVGTEDHTICPECNYYGRVRAHREVHLYPNHQAVWSNRYCCDTCADRMLVNTLKKNAPFLIGIPPNLMAIYKARTGKNPNFPQLLRANKMAQDGNIEIANQLYTLLLLRNNTHPGLHYNHGLAYWQNGNEEKAAARFREALNLCSNYKPILDFLKLHTPEEQQEE